MSAFDTIRRLIQNGQTKVLVLSRHGQKGLIHAILHAGAGGFIPKDEAMNSCEALAQALVDTARKRKLPMSHPLYEKLFLLGPEIDDMPRLAKRRIEIMQAIADTPLDAGAGGLSVIEEVNYPVEVGAGKIGGFDFGLKTFITDDEGGEYLSPEYLKASLSDIARLNRQLARKQVGSNNRQKAKRQLALTHDRIANQRRDAHFKLAHQLCDDYDVLGFEDLNLGGMKKLWGRKVSDLGFAQFRLILEHVAAMRGKRVVKIGRWEPTSQTCSCCGHRQAMALNERGFTCTECGLKIGRDHNAARNVRREAIALLGVGASTPRLEGVSRSQAIASLV